MNLRWLLGNFTDPQYRLPRREQFRLSRVAHEKHLNGTAFAKRTALIVAPALLYFALLKPALPWFGYAGSTNAFMVAGAAMLVVFWPWSAWMYRSLYAGPIRRAMREVGYDLCIECGYDLRGLGDNVKQCPECGAAREAIAEGSRRGSEIG